MMEDIAPTDYEAFIRVLTAGMRFKLALNEHRGDIGTVPIDRLLGLLTNEVTELRKAIIEGESQQAIILEAADVANFALAAAISAINTIRSKRQ